VETVPKSTWFGGRSFCVGGGGGGGGGRAEGVQLARKQVRQGKGGVSTDEVDRTEPADGMRETPEGLRSATDRPQSPKLTRRATGCSQTILGREILFLYNCHLPGSDNDGQL